MRVHTQAHTQNCHYIYRHFNLMAVSFIETLLLYIPLHDMHHTMNNDYKIKQF